jgi:type IV pilus assembly protein PilA
MRDTRRGFTLIELMMTVSIIGLLAAIAIPSFIGYQLRSRAAERPTIQRAIHDAVTFLNVRDGKFPTDLGGGSTGITCPANPPGAPGTAKRIFVESSGDWAKLSMTIEGALYYTYDVVGQAGVGGRWHDIMATGDLDGDGALHVDTQSWTYVAEALTAFADDDCMEASRGCGEF